MTVSELQARVDRGITWLDGKLLDWWHADRPSQGFENGGPIDLDALQMKHSCYCVLGQLLGSFYRAELTLPQAVAFGFDASTGADAPDEPRTDAEWDAWHARMADEFDALTELWSRVIEQRRAGVDVRG